MQRIIVLTLFLFAVVSNAQSPEPFKEISFFDKNDQVIEAPFYVEHVYDGRQFQDNIGAVMTGAFNAFAVAKTKNSLAQELKEYFSVVHPKSETKTPLSVRIIDLYVSEHQNGFTQNGIATVVVDIIEKKEGSWVVSGRFSSAVSSSRGDVTATHDDRIKWSLYKCFEAYMAMPEQEKQNLAFSPIKNVSTALPDKIRAGVYYDYSDLLNDAPQDTLDYEIAGWGDKKRLSRKSTGKPLQYYYAVSDGEALFLNVSRYSYDGCYAKADVIGNKLFVPDVFYNEKKSSLMWGSMFGLLGAVADIATSQKEGYIPMLIDSVTGRLTLLTDAVMKKMLADYPIVLKEYKKGKKAPSEIKAALRKVTVSNPVH